MRDIEAVEGKPKVRPGKSGVDDARDHSGEHFERSRTLAQAGEAKTGIGKSSQPPFKSGDWLGTGIKIGQARVERSRPEISSPDRAHARVRPRIRSPGWPG